MITLPINESIRKLLDTGNPPKYKCMKCNEFYT